MNAYDHRGFRIRSSQIAGPVLVPKYYNPEIPARLQALSLTHDLVSISTLHDQKVLSFSTGDEVGKMAYGTGSIPFVRTSDISNWEIITNPKQGVSENIYEKYRHRQDVRSGDIFFVRDGTYLIGNCCLITEADTKILYQSHILKIRVNKPDVLRPELLLAMLSSPIVRRQIKAKQFTADIIDTLGNRFLEIVLPIPKDEGRVERIEVAVSDIVCQRLVLRERIRRIPLWTEGVIASLDDEIPDTEVTEVDEGGSPSSLSFRLRVDKVLNNIFVPRYYDPHIEERLQVLSDTHDLVSIAALSKQGVLSLDTGIEIGKMAYGTGPIPFIRTSDITNWELKSDPKQNVSEELYGQFKDKLDVRAEDLFVVRDGTYLVGTSCILTEHDTRILYCGGLYKIRVVKKDQLDPYLLLALLNCPIVKRQMRAKQFTRDVIDTLGKRIYEVILPIPKDKRLCERIARETRETVLARVALRDKAKQIALAIEGLAEPGEEEKELLENI